MRYSVSTITGEPSALELQSASLVGFVCQTCVISPVHAVLPIKRILDQIMAPVAVQQYKVYFNDFGQCAGYLTWALLAPSVEKRLLRGESYYPQTSEWNEGGSLWIMDMAFPHGSIRHVLKDLRDNLFRDHETLTYFRIKNGKRIFKRVSRADGGHFFRSSRSQTALAKTAA